MQAQSQLRAIAHEQEVVDEHAFFGAAGYTLRQAARVVSERAGVLGSDLFGFVPMTLLGFAVVAVRTDRRDVLCAAIAAIFTLVYGLFYYGNAPIYGARHLFPIAPLLYVMVADRLGPDVAILKIKDYKGPYVARIDWTSTHAIQGEPAALIGFPAGADNALDAQNVVRSSMSAGIFSKVTPDIIQFDGFTVGGSSGSPIFNAAGEVVALHRAGLKQASGLGFAVPLARVFPLLRPELRAELGLK